MKKQTNQRWQRVSAVSIIMLSIIVSGAGCGIKSIEILKEDISGDKADVTYIIHYGNGMAPKNKQSLLKEDVWKLDGNGENIQ